MKLKEIGYFELLKTNSRFRIFWAAAVISMIGEWFNTIALFTLILKYSGSEALLGLLFTIRMLGFAILQPITGLLADRWSRKWIMVVSNLAQVGLALCFLMVDGPEDIWWLIGLSGLMMVLPMFGIDAMDAIPEIGQKVVTWAAGGLIMAGALLWWILMPEFEDGMGVGMSFFMAMFAGLLGLAAPLMDMFVPADGE